ncbi:tetratricopeptide repeat protein [candidate division KSB1 bacterium]|nr:tetratricopeptide repeat protein [candidate division KSB1 bacterium]
MNSPEVNARIEAARQLKRERKYTQAYQMLEDLLDNFKIERIDFLYSNMAHIKYLLGQYEVALRLAEQALHENPKNWFALSILGELALKQNQVQEAQQFFEEAHHLRPNDIFLLKRLLKTYAQMGKCADAFSLVKDALLRHPEASELFLALGDLYRATGEMEQAREQYLKAVQLDSKNHYAFRQWIATMEGDKSRSEILAEIEKLMKVPSQQNNPFLRDYYSQLLKATGQFTAAVAQLERTIEMAPGSLYRRTQLAHSYNQLTKFEQTVALLEPVYQQGVVDQYLYYELAVAYLGVGQKQTARNLLVVALQNFPNVQSLRKLLIKLK